MLSRPHQDLRYFCGSVKTESKQAGVDALIESYSRAIKTVRGYLAFWSRTCQASLTVCAVTAHMSKRLCRAFKGSGLLQVRCSTLFPG